MQERIRAQVTPTGVSRGFSNDSRNPSSTQLLLQVLCASISAVLCSLTCFASAEQPSRTFPGVHNPFADPFYRDLYATTAPVLTSSASYGGYPSPGEDRVTSMSPPVRRYDADNTASTESAFSLFAGARNVSDDGNDGLPMLEKFNQRLGTPLAELLIKFIESRPSRRRPYYRPSPPPSSYVDPPFQQPPPAPPVPATDGGRPRLPEAPRADAILPELFGPPQGSNSGRAATKLGEEPQQASSSSSSGSNNNNNRPGVPLVFPDDQRSDVDGAGAITEKPRRRNRFWNKLRNKQQVGDGQPAADAQKSRQSSAPGGNSVGPQEVTKEDLDALIAAAGKDFNTNLAGPQSPLGGQPSRPPLQQDHPLSGPFPIIDIRQNDRVPPLPAGGPETNDAQPRPRRRADQLLMPSQDPDKDTRKQGKGLPRQRRARRHGRPQQASQKLGAVGVPMTGTHSRYARVGSQTYSSGVPFNKMYLIMPQRFPMKPPSAVLAKMYAAGQEPLPNTHSMAAGREMHQNKAKPPPASPAPDHEQMDEASRKASGSHTGSGISLPRSPMCLRNANQACRRCVEKDKQEREVERRQQLEKEEQLKMAKEVRERRRQMSQRMKDSDHIKPPPYNEVNDHNGRGERMTMITSGVQFQPSQTPATSPAVGDDARRLAPLAGGSAIVNNLPNHSMAVGGDSQDHSSSVPRTAMLPEHGSSPPSVCRKNANKQCHECVRKDREERALEERAMLERDEQRGRRRPSQKNKGSAHNRQQDNAGGQDEQMAPAANGMEPPFNNIPTSHPGREGMKMSQTPLPQRPDRRVTSFSPAESDMENGNRMNSAAIGEDGGSIKNYVPCNGCAVKDHEQENSKRHQFNMAGISMTGPSKTDQVFASPVEDAEIHLHGHQQTATKMQDRFLGNHMRTENKRILFNPHQETINNPQEDSGRGRVLGKSKQHTSTGILHQDSMVPKPSSGTTLTDALFRNDYKDIISENHALSKSGQSPILMASNRQHGQGQFDERHSRERHASHRHTRRDVKSQTASGPENDGTRKQVMDVADGDRGVQAALSSCQLCVEKDLLRKQSLNKGADKNARKSMKSTTTSILLGETERGRTGSETKKNSDSDTRRPIDARFADYYDVMSNGDDDDNVLNGHVVVPPAAAEDVNKSADRTKDARITAENNDDDRGSVNNNNEQPSTSAYSDSTEPARRRVDDDDDDDDGDDDDDDYETSGGVGGGGRRQRPAAGPRQRPELHDQRRVVDVDVEPEMKLHESVYRNLADSDREESRRNQEQESDFDFVPELPVTKTVAKPNCDDGKQAPGRGVGPDDAPASTPTGPQDSGGDDHDGSSPAAIGSLRRILNRIAEEAKDLGARAGNAYNRVLDAAGTGALSERLNLIWTTAKDFLTSRLPES